MSDPPEIIADPTSIIPRDIAEAPFFVGIDVGGTGIKFGLVDNRGRSLARTSIPTHQEKGPEDACERMYAVVQSIAAENQVDPHSIVHVGLATPGTMDIAKGMLLQPHNLKAWWNFPIRDHLKKVLGKPVAFQNDANAAAYGEYWVGSGEKFRSMVLFTLGTGVGGGIIVDGKLIDGEHSHGSECGHTYIDTSPNARMCGCGHRGHLEAYASATAIVSRTNEALAAGRASSLATRIANGEKLTSLMVSQEAEKNDALSLDIVMETAVHLSYGAVNLIHIIDPDVVVFGGAMDFGGMESDLGRRFLDRIRSETHSRAFKSLEGKTHISFASLGEHAGYIGAAGVARAAYAVE